MQVSPLSAYPELHHLVQYGPKVWQNQNLFPYLRLEPGAFNNSKQRLTAQSSDFKEASHEEIYLISLNNGHRNLAFANTGMAVSQMLQCSVLFQSFNF